MKKEDEEEARKHINNLKKFEKLIFFNFWPLTASYPYHLFVLVNFVSPYCLCQYISTFFLLFILFVFLTFYLYLFYFVTFLPLLSLCELIFVNCSSFVTNRHLFSNMPASPPESSRKLLSLVIYDYFRQYYKKILFPLLWRWYPTIFIYKAKKKTIIEAKYKHVQKT